MFLVSMKNAAWQSAWNANKADLFLLVISPSPSKGILGSEI
jgi:hypothetical protein